MNANTAGSQIDWLLDDLVTRVAHVQHAIVLSRDGLPVGSSRGLGRDNSERLSALAAGLQSLARGVGEQFDGGRVRQAVVELDDLFLFVTASGEGTCLAVVATADAEIGLIAYQMATLVQKVGRHLAARQRSDALEARP
ncbi:roadblock/LC7 domain-containing protein [Actinocorallia aurea]